MPNGITSGWDQGQLGSGEPSRGLFCSRSFHGEYSQKLVYLQHGEIYSEKVVWTGMGRDANGKSRDVSFLTANSRPLPSSVFVPDLFHPAVSVVFPFLTLPVPPVHAFPPMTPVPTVFPVPTILVPTVRHVSIIPIPLSAQVIRSHPDVGTQFSHHMIVNATGLCNF